MADTIDNLPDLLGEATLLAIKEHLETLRMENSEEVSVPVMGNPESGKSERVANPHYIKIKGMKNRAASDILQIMAKVDSNALKGRRTDRTVEIIKRIREWSGANSAGGHA